MADSDGSCEIEIHNYDTLYRLRRSQSTMAVDAVAWSTESVWQWLRSRPHGLPFRILSVGCGDGSLDLEIIEAARRFGPVQYIGCDVNPDSLAVFAGALSQRDSDSELVVRLLHGPIEKVELDEPVDLVLVAHVLYYLDDPVSSVQMLLNRYCAVDGRVVIIHSGFRGVASMVEAALGTSPFVTAEQIAAGLISLGLRPTRHVLPGRLCIEDAITDSSLGRALLSFIVERDPLSDQVRELLVNEMVERSIVLDGARWLPEDLLVLEVRCRLRPAVRTVQREVVDAVQDYHVLAEAFNWDERLRSLPSGNGTPPSMLDVGCGTGRWLRVLASAFPEMTATQRGNIIYDRVDPSIEALAPNAVIASELFTLGTTWCEGIENAALPVNRYGLIWAVHSLYGVPEVKLEGVLRRLMDSVAHDGVLIVVLGDPGSFYLEAKPNLVGGGPFTSSYDVLFATEQLGLSTTLTNLRYTEVFDVADEDSIRRYVWHEAIGNTYLPAGLSGESLPELPSGEWWESHRCGDCFEFVQSVSVLIIESN